MISSVEWHDNLRDCAHAWNTAATRFYEDGYSLITCPCCKEGTLRIYWQIHHREILPDGKRRRRAGGWMWCPVCRSYEHWSGFAPDWWPDSELAASGTIHHHHPQELEEQWTTILQKIVGKEPEFC
jgi:hypothetical protein